MTYPLPTPSAVLSNHAVGFVRTVWITLRASLREAMGNRGGLLLEMGLMILNDVVWLIFWGLFFRVTPVVNGWEFRDTVLLQASLTVAGGISLGMFANARHIGRLALNGEIDAALTLPSHPLAHLIARRMDAVFLGDLVFGLVVFFVACQPTPLRALWFMSCAVIASVLITSFMVLASSTAFFTGRTEGGELSFHGIVLFAAYPIDLVGGSARMLLYTIIPSAFVASVPVQLINDPDLGRLAAMVGVTACFTLLSVWVFTVGLRRYTSGSAWTSA
jgi:ABC-2 type transport system permease protein